VVASRDHRGHRSLRWVRPRYGCASTTRVVDSVVDEQIEQAGEEAAHLVALDWIK
jgi:hypothetical protein